MQALREADGWPAENVALAVVGPEGVLEERGNARRSFRWASVTKPVTALAVLVAAEEGSLDLDEPGGPPGSTVRHLLAHASGLPFEGAVPIAPPGKRRIYSNSGFEELGGLLEERTEMPFAEYLQAAALAPTVVAPETLGEARSVQFPGLAGVIPDLGRFDPNDWGLGFEIKGSKQPHFSGTLTSPRTFGHWGGSGTFLWVDPERDLALGALTDLEFGDWAKEGWPALSDAVVREH